MAFPPLDKEALLDLWRRINPPSYTVPIETEYNGQGFDVPSAQAQVFAAADQAVNDLFQQQFLLPSAVQTGEPANGGRKAVAEVEILRNTSTAGAIDLDVGTRLIARQTGSLGQEIELVDFLLAEPLAMPEGDRGPFTVLAQAEVEGYVGNVVAGSIQGFLELGRASMQAVVLAVQRVQRVPPAPGQPITDRFTLGMVGRYVTLVGLPSGATAPRKITAVDVANQEITVQPALDPADVGATFSLQVNEWADLGLVVSQPENAAGGRLAWLDAIGRDRATGRVVGEPDDAFRERVCQLADTISPAALRRTIERILTPCGVNWAWHETRDVQTLKGFVWDLDPLDFGQVPPVPRDPAGDLYGEGAVLLDESMAWTFFLVRVGFGNEGEFGAPYDALNPSFPNAWDWFFFDGQPVGYNSCIGQLWEALNGARAAGVNFLIFRDPGLT